MSHRAPETTIGRRVLDLLLLMGLAACARGSQPAGDDQYAFARDWIAVYGERDATKADARLRELDERWRGRRASWEVLVIEPLCRAGGCNVMPFDRARLPKAANDAVGGAMPRFELPPDEYRELTRRCLAYEHRCVARIEARIAALPEDADSPLALRFEDGRLESVRELGARELFRRPAPRLARRDSRPPDMGPMSGGLDSR